MATLLDHAQQGDVATIGDDSQITSTLKLMEPQQLYELWERQPWQSQSIDLEQDKRDWAEMPDGQREEILWLLSAFFIGEERVTTQFSGLVMSYDDEQEEAFLTTQQVDEARHYQHFDRFYREVVGLDQEDFTDRLARVRGELNDSFVKLFDEELVAAGQRLIADPSDREAKVDFVTTYHMVIEGTLALTGQNFITDYFQSEGILPGFVEGFGNVARDEHRHVAYGTWYLAENVGEDESLASRMQDRLQELLPVAAGVLVPKGQDPSEDWQLLGYHSREINEFAFKSLTRRLNAIGVPLQGAPVAA